MMHDKNEIVFCYISTMFGGGINNVSHATAPYEPAVIEYHLREYVASNSSVSKYTKDNNIARRTFNEWIIKYNNGEYTFKIGDVQHYREI